MLPQAGYSIHWRLGGRGERARSCRGAGDTRDRGIIRAVMQKPGATLTLLILGAILLAGWAMRATDLDADPPEKLSWSQGPYTDGALVVHNARNDALFGSWIRDHANDIYFYPLANLATRAVFSVAGVGRGQAAFANTIFGVLSILLIATAILRACGPPAAILFTLFAAFHYYLVMYDRLAIAEPAMIFLIAVSVFLFERASRGNEAGRSPTIVAGMAGMAGLFAAAAVLIGKAHALYFPLAMLLAFLIAAAGSGKKNARHRNRRLVYALLGMGVAALLWAALLGVPHADYIFSQASRATIEKHGDDPRQVLAQIGINLFHMGVESNSVQRMPVLFVLAMIGILGIVSKPVAALRKEPPLVLLFLCWLVLGWATIATQHTPSPRYLLALLIPMIYLATRPLTALLGDGKLAWSLPREPRTRAAGLFVIFFVAYQAFAVTGLVERAAPGIDPLYETLILLAGATAVLGILHLAYSGKRKLAVTLAWSPGRRRAMVGTLVIAVLVMHVGRWVSWKTTHTHYLRDASIDIARSLGEDAALIGPYAPTFGLDNELPAYPFLGRYERPGLLQELRPTHMVLVTRIEQAEIERRYPELAAGWTFAGLYPIRMQYADKIVVYRLPRSLGGAPLHYYEPSAMERAIDAIAAEDFATPPPLLEPYLAQHPENAEAHYLLGVCYFKQDRLQDAIPLIERAATLRPDRPLYHFRLGDYYARAGRSDEALTALERACVLNPDDDVFRNARDTMRARAGG